MRILGITIKDDAQMQYALTALYGIGLSRAQAILKEAGNIPPTKKVKEITDAEEAALRKVVESLKLEGDLKREISRNIKRLKDIQSYRGVRHMKSLPTRGQRTKTNARTRKGKKKTMGSGRRTVSKT